MTNESTCDIEELRSLFLFEKLDEEQLAWLCRDGRVERIDPGLVFREGDAATCFYVLLDGGLRLTRLSRGEEIETVRTDKRGVYAGAWSAYLGDRVEQRYDATMYVTEPARFFVLAADTFSAMMHSWFPMAVHLLEGLFFGTRHTNQILDQRERLLALGSLSAGLTHELNNPAAAAVRATASLRERIAGMRHKLEMIA
ncbi:MAG: cyclic nucleotide-binding domain-containing protein, partial [Aldersonia sp.]|nr:cyclic nucleotide-binding domain-containing protein [Aldersonia sp.]